MLRSGSKESEGAHRDKNENKMKQVGVRKVPISIMWSIGSKMSKRC